MYVTEEQVLLPPEIEKYASESKFHFTFFPCHLSSRNKTFILLRKTIVLGYFWHLQFLLSFYMWQYNLKRGQTENVA